MQIETPATTEMGFCFSSLEIIEQLVTIGNILLQFIPLNRKKKLARSIIPPTHRFSIIDSTVKQREWQEVFGNTR